MTGLIRRPARRMRPGRARRDWLARDWQAFDVRTYSFGPFRPAAAQQRHGPRMPG